MNLHDRIMDLPLCASYAGRDLEAVELRNQASEIGAEGDARIAELEQCLKRQANAAKMGMDAAKKSGAAMYEHGKKMLAESSPEAIESERAANAILTARVDELEQCLREARANMADWGCYVDEYFREKHRLAEDLAAIDRVLGGDDEKA